MDAKATLTRQQQQQPPQPPTKPTGPPPLSQQQQQIEHQKTLEQLLKIVNDNEPTIPDAVITHFLTRAGCNLADPKLTRLFALAAQKFVFEVVYDAHNQRALQLRAKQSQKAGKAATPLTLPELVRSLEERGITVAKPPEFFGGSAGTLTGVASTVSSVPRPTTPLQSNSGDSAASEFG